FAPSEALAVVTIAILLAFTYASNFSTSVAKDSLVSKTFHPSRAWTVPASTLIAFATQNRAAITSRYMRFLIYRDVDPYIKPSRCGERRLHPNAYIRYGRTISRTKFHPRAIGPR